METMLDLGVTGMLEMPPAGTLTGIAKRAMKGVETFALKTPDQLDDARAFVDKHGDASRDRHHPDLADAGRARQGHLPPDRRPRRGRRDRPGRHDRRRRRACATRPPSRAPHGGTIVEWLVEDGDLVSPGQPLIRLHPEGVNA